VLKVFFYDQNYLKRIINKWFAGVEAFGFLNCVLKNKQLLKDAVEFALLVR